MIFCKIKNKIIEADLLVFGVGLIGSAVMRSVENRFATETKVLPFSWTNSNEQEQQLSALTKLIAGQSPLIILWSAGRAGFNATTEDVSEELASFKRVLQFAEKEAQKRKGVRFLLISSAGGLFEGQRLVTQSSIPSPRRPYGLLKLEQEKLLRSSSLSDHIIVRLTSVFGTIRPGQRRGLIPTLIQNGLSHQTSMISGRISTLRDFIWVDDVAEFLMNCISHRSKENVVTLTRGKPTSILEVQRVVERVLRKRIYVMFLPESDNDSDITFAPALSPRTWQTTDLHLAISRVAHSAIAQEAV